MAADEADRQLQEFRRQALANFPLKLIETTGAEALAKWQELKSSGEGSPVVLGGDGRFSSFDNLLDPFGPVGPDIPQPSTVEEILARAADISFPDDLIAHDKAEQEALIRKLKADLAARPDSDSENAQAFPTAEFIAALEREPPEPPIGEWPKLVYPSPGLSVALDISTGDPLPKVYIGLAPTDDWTAIPAYLRWGGWNGCPPPEYHVAALRLWRDRYGAELVGLNSDTMNLRVANPPKAHEEALALARDQYVYCPDIIDQGVQTYRALAADRMMNEWWYFWWD